jgi:hypothetical protein
MNHKTVKTSAGQIDIFDDLFDYATREKFYYYVKNANFSTSGSDTSTLETKGDFNLYCALSNQQVEQMGFLNQENTKYITPYVEGMDIKQSRINLSTLNDRNRFHTDTYGDLRTKTLLYYPNLKWDKEWGGHTLFTDKTGNELEYCCFYVPGRVILFDGQIPHCIAPPSSMAPSYRFSFVIQYGAVK